MNKKEDDPITEAIVGHGDQLSRDLVFLKKFLQARQEEQFAFLREQRQASDRAQEKATSAAIWSAIAAGAAALATIVLAVDAYLTP